MVTCARAISVGGLIAACLCLAAMEPRQGDPPAAGSVTATELVEIQGLSGLSVSPNGRDIAVRVDQQDITSNVTRLAWYVVPARGGKIVRAAEGGEAGLTINGGLLDETPVWSPDGNWLYYRAIGAEGAQVWRASRRGGSAVQVTHERSDVLAFDIEPDGALQMAVAGAVREDVRRAERAEYDAGVLLDRSIIPGYRPAYNFPLNGRMASLRAPQPGAHFRTTLLGGRSPTIKVMKVGHVTRPAPAEAKGRFEANWSAYAGRFAMSGYARFRPRDQARIDGREQVFSADRLLVAELVQPIRPDGHPVLSWKHADDGPSVACKAKACLDADAMFVAGWSGNELVFQTVTFGTEALHVWDTKRDVVRTLVASEASLGSDASGRQGGCRLAAREAICIAASAEEPPRLVAIDLATGARRVLLDPNPGLTPDRLGRAEKIVLHDRFGRTAFGRLVLPRDGAGDTSAGRLPLVITSYICPGFLLGGVGADVPEHVLAGRGYAALCVDTAYWNVRNPPGFRGTQESINQSTIDFFTDAIRVLDARGLIDPHRVAVTGFSGSATAITWGLARSKAFTAAIITTRSGSDPITCYLNTVMGTCRRRAQERGGRPPYDAAMSLATDSPALDARAITTPLLMQLAEVEYVDMMQLYSALTDLERPVEMRIFPDEYHAKHQPRHRLAVYQRNVEWIEFWLRGREAQDPTLADQYHRWREGRAQLCRLPEDAWSPTTPWYCGKG